MTRGKRGPIPWRWRDLPLRYKGMLVLVIPVVPLMVTAELFYSSQLGADQAERLVAETLRVKGELAATRTLFVDAEAGARGYVLTRNAEALAAYKTATDAISPRLRTLMLLLSEDRSQLARLERLPALAEGRPLASLIDYASAAPPGSPPPGALLERSRQSMNALRGAVREMQTVEDERLAARTAVAHAARRRGTIVMIGGVGFGLAVTLLAAGVFASAISGRIGQVAANSGRLARGEPLVPMPSARDEVGELAASLSAAAELLRQRDALLQQRMRDLTTANAELEYFSHSVSHDLRAPLRHVAGFAALLQKRVGDDMDAEAARYLRTIVGSAARMGRLVDDLLAFSRMGRAEMLEQRVDLDEVVRDVVREISQDAAGRRINWTTHPLPSVAGDPAMLRLVFANLVSNAVKYTAPRPVAEIEIGATPALNGERVVYVRDNGVGFDMAYADKLFGVFQRLHTADQFEGTGIGLANVRRIVQRHGGRTWAEGAVDRGATFFVSLPGGGPAVD